MLTSDANAALQQLAALLQQVPHTPQLRVPQVVARQRMEECLAAVPSPQLRQAMIEAFAQMLQGMGHGFRVLQGGPRPPAAAFLLPPAAPRARRRPHASPVTLQA